MGDDGQPRRRRSWRLGASLLAVAGAALAVGLWHWRQSESPEAHRALVDRYCIDCHNGAERAGGLMLEHADIARAEENAELWEAVVRKLRVAMMPPRDA